MLHPAQAKIDTEAKRFNVVNCGRRWGKTLYGVRRVLNKTLAGQPIGWFAPSYKLMIDVWRDVASRLEPLSTRISSSEHRIELITGGVLDMWSMADTVDPGRGRAYAEVIVDEAAMIPKLEEAWTKSIRPTLTDLSGGAWFFSTPRGINYFHALRQKSGSDAEWMGWDMPTESNPFIPPREIEVARNELPERVFAQEYLAQFIDDGGGVFRNVTACTTSAQYPHSSDPRDGRAFVIGVDWGRVNDFTVITVIDAQEKRVAVLDRFNQIDYHFQLARLEAIARRFPGSPILAEANAMGQPLIEQLRRRGHWVHAFQTTAASKAQIIESLAIAFETAAITIPADKVLVGELLAFDQTRLPSGLVRYSAPEGQHDDCVMSLAIAWHGVIAAPPRVLTFTAPML